MHNPSRRGEGEVITTIAIVFAILIIIGLMAGCPSYNVYLKEKSGQAERAQAEGNRQITVLEAQAKMDSAKLLAQAEVERAKGVAEANRIIGESLKGNEVYLHYLWVNNLHEGRNDVIYVPTEAGIPVMEAGRAVSPRKVEK